MEKIGDSIDKAIKHFENKLDKIYIYCNQGFSSDNKSFSQINEKLERANIEYELITGNSIWEQVRNHVDLMQRFFMINADDLYKSFRAQIDLQKPLPTVSEPYHYRNSHLTYRGRNEEIQKIWDFLEIEDDLKWMAVVGAGGVGKSKLLYYFSGLLCDQEDWKAIWLRPHEIVDFSERFIDWYYPKNLLIIIDYAGTYASNLGKWLFRLSCTPQQFRPKKMRFILVERENLIYNYQFPHNTEPMWVKLLWGNTQEQRRILENEMLYKVTPNSYFLQLEGLVEREDCEKLICEHLGIMDVEKETAKINLIISSAQRIDKEFMFPRPLYLLFVADAINENETVTSWDIDKLITFIYERLLEQWSAALTSNYINYLSYLKQLIVYATSCKGWKVEEQLEPPFSRAAKKLLELENGHLQSVLLSVNMTGVRNVEIHALEPDLVGEFFVLTELIKTADPLIRKEMINVFWNHSEAFYEFLYRCCQTYCDADIFSDIFGNGFIYMKPETFIDDKCLLMYAGLLYKLVVSLEEKNKKEAAFQHLANLYENNKNDQLAVLYALATRALYLSNKETAVVFKKSVRENFYLDILKDIYSEYKYSAEVVRSYSSVLAESDWREKISNWQSIVSKFQIMQKETKYTEVIDDYWFYFLRQGLFQENNQISGKSSLLLKSFLAESISSGKKYDEVFITNLYKQMAAYSVLSAEIETFTDHRYLSFKERYMEEIESNHLSIPMGESSLIERKKPKDSYIYLSYAISDFVYVQKLVDYLNKHNYKNDMFHKVEQKKYLYKIMPYKISKSIADSKAALFLLSENTQKSASSVYELFNAFYNKKKMILFVLDQAGEKMAHQFSNNRNIKIYNLNKTDSLDELVKKYLVDFGEKTKDEKD